MEVYLFEFDGTIIFISNYDFDAMIGRGHKLAPHLQAMISRAHYLDLAMKTRQDYLVRIRQVIEQGMLDGMKENEKNDVIEYIEKNYMRLQEISIRTAIKIAKVRRNNPNNWERICNLTCCVTR